MTTINVRDFGAVGDGQADDTAAIRKALAALPTRDSVLYFPPGHYRTDVIKAKSFTTYKGDSAWAYSFRAPGGTVISPLKPDQPCLIDAGKAQGTYFLNLTLRGTIEEDNPGDGAWNEGGKPATHNMAGISYVGGCDRTVIEGCRIERFSGSGVVLTAGGVWTIRHSLLLFNRLHGLQAAGAPDGWVLDSMLTANGGAGLTVGASVTITGNRIEHNHRAGLLINPGYAAALQITGNLFCSNRGPGIEHDGNVAEGITITGNTVRRLADVGVLPEPRQQCQVLLVYMQGLNFTGNSIYCDRQCADLPTGMIIGKLKDSVVSGNTLQHAAARELIRDDGGHENVVIDSNPGSLLGQ